MADDAGHTRADLTAPPTETVEAGFFRLLAGLEGPDAALVVPVVRVMSLPGWVSVRAFRWPRATLPGCARQHPIARPRSRSRCWAFWAPKVPCRCT